jgi:hypothetical protein
MLPDEVSGEIREGGGHCVKPHKDWVDCSTNVCILRCLEDIADDNPVTDHVTEFKVPVQRISAERVLKARSRELASAAEEK